MKKQALFVTGALVVLLTGCGAIDRKQEGEPAMAAGARMYNAPTAVCEKTHTECNITVQVGPNCAIRVVPDKKRVKIRDGGVPMVWTIQGDAVFQPGKGIRFKRQLAAADVFRIERFKMGSNTWRMHNPAKTPGDYEYAVNVSQGGKDCKEYDPGVVNEW